MKGLGGDQSPHEKGSGGGSKGTMPLPGLSKIVIKKFTPNAAAYI